LIKQPFKLRVLRAGYHLSGEFVLCSKPVFPVQAKRPALTLPNRVGAFGDLPVQLGSVHDNHLKCYGYKLPNPVVPPEAGEASLLFLQGAMTDIREAPCRPGLMALRRGRF
jgi:hypothetical protein